LVGVGEKRDTTRVGGTGPKKKKVKRLGKGKRGKKRRVQKKPRPEKSKKRNTQRRVGTSK